MVPVVELVTAPSAPLPVPTTAPLILRVISDTDDTEAKLHASVAPVPNVKLVSVQAIVLGTPVTRA